MEPFQPRLDQPFGLDQRSWHGHAGTELAVLEAGAVVAGWVQHAELDVVRVQQLLLQNGRLLPGRPPGGRRRGARRWLPSDRRPRLSPGADATRRSSPLDPAGLM